MWSLRPPPAKVNASAAAPATTTTRAAARPLPSAAFATRIERRTEPTSAGAAATTPVPAAEPQVLERARALARRPDVAALMALRDDVVRRAAEQGAAGSPTVKGELAELDLRLNEARMLRLKLDAEELRKASRRD